MPRAEVLLWIQLKNKQMMGYKFRRQVSINNKIVDFYCPKLKLAIEVDGATHVTDKEKKRDKERQEEIGRLEIHFLRFINSEIYYDMANVLDRIRKKIIELGEDLPLPPPS
jgi:very-short-patch-repair endonuclease